MHAASLGCGPARALNLASGPCAAASPHPSSRRARHAHRKRWWLSEPDQAQAQLARPGGGGYVTAADQLVVLQPDVGDEHERQATQQTQAPISTLHGLLPDRPPPCAHDPQPETQLYQDTEGRLQWQMAVGADSIHTPMLSHNADQAPAIRNPAAHLMGMIKQRETLCDLAALLRREESMLNALHASAAVTHAAQLAAALPPHPEPLPPGLLHELTALLLRHARQFGPRQVANSLWACGKLCALFPPPPALVDAAAALLVLVPGVAADMQPGERAGAWYALGVFRRAALPCGALAAAAVALVGGGAAATVAWHTTQPRELCGMLWAAARLADGADTAQGAAFTLARHVLPAVQHAAPRMEPRELTTALWSLGQLSLHSVRSTGEHTYSSRQLQGDLQPDQGPPVSVYTVTQRVARRSGGKGSVERQLELAGAAAAVCDAATVHVPGIEPGGAAQALFALPHLPPSPARDRLAGELLKAAARHAASGALTPHAAAAMMLAASRLRLPAATYGTPGSWTDGILRAVLQGAIPGGSCTAADLTTALHALIALGVAPSPASARQLLAHGQALVESGAVSPHQLAGLLWACARLNLLPPLGFMAAFQKASYAARDALAPADVAAVFWALGRLGLRPGRKWLQDVLAALWWRRAEYTTAQLMQVLWALGRMHTALSPSMCDKLLGELRGRWGSCGAVPRADGIALLTCLARLPLLPDAVVRWAAAELVPGLLAPSVFEGREVPWGSPPHVGEVVAVLWATARLARRLPARPPPDPWAQPPRKQQLTPFEGAAALLRHDSGPEANGVCTTLAGTHVETSPAATAYDGRDVLGDGVTVSHHVPLQASTAGLPALRTSSAALGLLAWQPLRKQPGRLALTPGQVERVLGLALAAFGPPRPHAAGMGGGDPTATVEAAKQLSALLYAVPQLNVRPSRAWMTAVLFSRPTALRKWPLHPLALTLFALGCLRMRPPPDWLAACLHQVLANAPRLNTGMVSGVLRGLSLLDVSPGGAWLSRFVTAALPALGLMPPKQLAAAHQAVMDLEPQLAEAWGPGFSVLLGRASRSALGDDDCRVQQSDRQLDDPTPWEGAAADPDQGLRAGEVIGVTHALQRPFRRL